MDKIKHFAFLAFLAASSGLLGGTATKEYVDRRDLTIAVAATNYTDAAVAAVGGVTRETVTNIAEYVTGNATNGLPEAIASKYTKPAGGIPAGDIAAGVIPSVPTKWALSSVTNSQGRAVGAADVGALPVTGGTITNANLSSPSVLRIGRNSENEEESGYGGELYIGGNGLLGEPDSNGGLGKLYIGGMGYVGGNGEVRIGSGGDDSGGDGKLVVGGENSEPLACGRGEIIVKSSSENPATVTIGNTEYGGVLTVGGSDVITANTTNSFAQGIVSVAMSASESYTSDRIGLLYDSSDLPSATNGTWKTALKRDIPSVPNENYILGAYSSSLANGEIRTITVGATQTITLSLGTSASASADAALWVTTGDSDDCNFTFGPNTYTFHGEDGYAKATKGKKTMYYFTRFTETDIMVNKKEFDQ